MPSDTYILLLLLVCVLFLALAVLAAFTAGLLAGRRVEEPGVLPVAPAHRPVFRDADRRVVEPGVLPVAPARRTAVRDFVHVWCRFVAHLRSTSPFRRRWLQRRLWSFLGTHLNFYKTQVGLDTPRHRAALAVLGRRWHHLGLDLAAVAARRRQQ